MDSLPPSMQALAEELSGLVIELTAGLLERPAPDPTLKTSLDALCRTVVPVLQRAVPAIADTIKEINHLGQVCEDLDDLVDLVEDLSAPALDLVDCARQVWASTVLVEEEGAKALLARMAEVPVVELLGQIQPLVHAAVLPEAFLGDAEEAKLNLYFSGNYTKERDELIGYCQRHNIKLSDVPAKYL